MSLQEMIEETMQLLKEQFEIAPDNPIEEQYKSRCISNYASALKTLIELERKG